MRLSNLLRNIASFCSLHNLRCDMPRLYEKCSKASDVKTTIKTETASSKLPFIHIHPATSRLA
ncbi:MAG TPA: hypothetical protein ENJ59_00515 [Thermofilum sp.]|nr:hypothetical protein [Thermofilum sp.]